MINHTYKTRLLHCIIAVLVMVQLSSIFIIDNKFFSESIRTNLFTVHKYGGLISFIMLFLFWIVIVTRQQGTSLKRLFPWICLAGLKEFKHALMASVKNILQFKIPSYSIISVFASAFHGLGIIIMSIMAITGTHRFIVYEFALEKTPLIKFISSLHHVFADYAWIYLIIHAFMALLNHVLKIENLSKMWSLKKCNHQ